MIGLQHYDEQLQAIEKRIARLAMLCDADLSRDDVVTGLIKGNFQVCRKPEGMESGYRNELRALLVLKYNLEKHCLDDLGEEQWLRIVTSVHVELLRIGFPPESIPE